MFEILRTQNEAIDVIRFPFAPFTFDARISTEPFIFAERYSNLLISFLRFLFVHKAHFLFMFRCEFFLINSTSYFYFTFFCSFGQNTNAMETVTWLTVFFSAQRICFEFWRRIKRENKTYRMITFLNCELETNLIAYASRHLMPSRLLYDFSVFFSVEFRFLDQWQRNHLYITRESHKAYDDKVLRAYLSNGIVSAQSNFIVCVRVSE